jgi:hypothetical protein
MGNRKEKKKKRKKWFFKEICSYPYCFLFILFCFLLLSFCLGAFSENIKVLVRVRPPNDRERESGGSLQCVVGDTTNNTVTVNASAKPELFTFDVVADVNTSQVCLYIYPSQKKICSQILQEEEKEVY